MNKTNLQFIEDNLFTEIVGLLPIVTTDLVILNESQEQIFLFKRTNKPAQNLYFTPGGRILKNEDLLTGIIRQGKKEIARLSTRRREIFTDFSCFRRLFRYVLSSVGRRKFYRTG